MTDDWLDRFPGLRRFEPQALALLRREARVVDLPPGGRAFASGQPCQAYLFVVDGRLKVRLTGEGGREIVLYRAAPGETCILTTTALLSDDNYMAEGIAETPVRAIAIPAAAFRRLIAESAAFREFVFAMFAHRIMTLMQVVQDVAFGQVGPRLAAALLAGADPDDSLGRTHQDLAAELGTAREVVSRQLKAFERRGWVRLGRGRIAIAARDRLAAFAGGDENFDLL